MKTLWTILAALAVVNILAVAGLFGWLKATDRLSPERVRAVREVFLKTVPEEHAVKAQAEAEKAAHDAEREKAAKLAQPPRTADERIAEAQVREDVKLQHLQRQQQDLDNLRAQIARDAAALDDKRRRFDADKAAFDAQRKALLERESTDQFKTALATLEGQKPKDAKAILRALIIPPVPGTPPAAGTPPLHGVDQAVAYLARMDESKRSKIIAEFVKDDPAMAADLLQRLRTRGLTQAAPPAPPAAPAPAQAEEHAPDAANPRSGPAQPATAAGSAGGQRP